MVKFDLKVVLDDVRARDTALLNSIFASDRQAVSLFRVFVTLALALVSASVAIGLNGNFVVSHWQAAGAACAVLGLCLACWHCIRAIRTASVALPGKGAEFWEWAICEDVEEKYALDVYLQQSKTAQDQNFLVNQQSAASLKLAKLFAIASVIIGAALVLIDPLGIPKIVAQVFHLP